MIYLSNLTFTFVSMIDTNAISKISLPQTRHLIDLRLVIDLINNLTAAACDDRLPAV